MKRALLALLLLLSAAATMAQQTPGLQKGFVADKAYFTGDVDNINTFNGNLTMQLPIGPAFPVNGGLSYSLNLAYNSKVWDYIEFDGTFRAVPNRRSNAGLGWLLSFGRIYDPRSPGNDSDETIYESADGADHSLPGKLHPSDPAPVTNAGFTTDASYLRMLQVHDTAHDPADYVELDSPDGIVREFDAANGRLTKIRDRSGNFVKIEILTAASGTPCTSTTGFAAAWRITDSQSSRTNYVCFATQLYPDSTADGRVERVVLAAPPDPTTGAARTATYLFNYTGTLTHRGCHSTYQNDSSIVPVPVLSSVTLPDGSSHSFTYNITESAVCDQGTLASYRRPTGATTTYTYRSYFIPTENCKIGGWNSSMTGVGTRTISGPKIPTATWTYNSVLSSPNASIYCENGPLGARILRNAPSEEMLVTITDPLGNVTENPYTVWPVVPGTDLYDPNGNALHDANGNPIRDTSARGFVATEYGLPMTRATQSAGKFLTLRTYAAAGYAADPKQPLRSVFGTWDHENGQCLSLLDECRPWNPRVASRRIEYHDDGGNYVNTENSDFDGLGHYRRVVTSGSLPGATREVYTAFNVRAADVNPGSGIDSGSYPANFHAPATTDAWVLGNASYVTVSDSDTATTQTCHDATTGSLKAMRVWKGTSRGPADLLTVYGFDASNNLTSESYYGGDVRANAPMAGSLCDAADSPPAVYDYRIDHGYQWGVRSTSQYHGMPFTSLNLTIHRATGLPLFSTDSSGHTTGFGYDTSSRLVKESPPDLSPTTYAYVNASAAGAPFAPARITATTPSAQGFGTIETEYQYDAIGHLWRTKQHMPDDSWSIAETLRNGMGWVVSQSERQTLTVPAGASEYDVVLAGITTQSDYDPFGRVGKIRAPDDSTTTLAYAGVRETARTQTIATATDPSRSVTTREDYDLLGRLISVTEAVGLPEEATTSYDYDIGDRLISVAAGAQTRTFQYDHRGLLQFAQHPELGAAGNGRVAYGTFDANGAFTGKYDARGHALRVITGTANGPFDLSFTYDGAERVTSVSETATARPLKQFAYDDPFGATYANCSGGRCKGKLAAAARWNYSPSLGTIAATESYEYNGPGGLISRRDRSVGAAAGFANGDFFFTQAYTDQGLIASIGYPCRTVAGACHSADPARTVSNEYTRGLLTRAAPWSTSLTYQPNGLPATITHGSGSAAIAETWTADPMGMARPGQISALNSAGATLWTTGTYTYDGSGNVRAMGADTYAYDALGRLQRWTAGNSTAPLTTSLDYDRYGNILNTSIGFCRTASDGSVRCGGSTGIPKTIAGTTNHYAGSVYDAAGNVTSDGTRSFTYDALGVANGATVNGRTFAYLYSPDDERIASVELRAGGNRTVWTLRGFENQLLRTWTDETSSGIAATWTEDEIWRGSQLLGTESPSGTRHYVLDHLGSPRLVADATGAHVQNFAPFGGGGTTGSGELQFTGHERDASTLGNGTADLPDYMHARFYDAGAGRFLSVDPGGYHLEQPQSWNRYSYVRNNPLNAVDSTGRVETGYKCDANGDNCVYETTQSAEQYTALDTTLDFVDTMAAQAVSPALMVMDATLKDDAKEFAFGTAGLVIAGAPGGAVAALTRPASVATTSLLSRSSIALNLGGEGEVAGAGVVNVQAGSMGGDRGLAIRSAVDVARTTNQRVVVGTGNALPFRTGAVNQVITNNVPVDAGLTYFGQSLASHEIYRVLSPLGQWFGSSAP